MSKKRKIIIASAVVLVVTAIILCVLLFDSASIGENVKGELYYSDNSTSFCTNITDEESTEIAKMINGKPMHFLDDAVYRFSDEVYLSFEDGEEIKNYYIDCNGCEALRYDDRVIYLEIEETERLIEILTLYDVKFPIN